MQHFMRVSPRVHRLGEEHDLRVIGRVLRAMQHTHTNTQPMPYDHRAQESKRGQEGQPLQSHRRQTTVSAKRSRCWRC